METPIKPRSKNAKRPARKTKGGARHIVELPGLPLIQVERACGELRSGFPIMVTSAQGCCLALAPETMIPETVNVLLSALSGLAPVCLLTSERGDALKLRRYTEGVLAIPVAPNLNAIMAMRELADPSRDLSSPLRGPFAVQREPLPIAAATVVRLAKIANLLPGAIAWFLDRGRAKSLMRSLDIFGVGAAEIDAYRERTARTLQLVTRAKLPLKNAENAQILAFRPPSGDREHLVILIGDPSPERPPLVRVHSECFTGDLLGSLKCDCGDQLRGAIQHMGSQPEGGVLLYLAQEGRGIGLVNKLRAYNLQDQGYDTVDANTRLGFEPDERQFTVACEILKRLGFGSVRLLTNNPEKVSALEAEGIHVVERVPHAFPVNPHNADYLRVKADKSGHLL